MRRINPDRPMTGAERMARLRQREREELERLRAENEQLRSEIDLLRPREPKFFVYGPKRRTKSPAE
jgi:hypothetical protein